MAEIDSKIKNATKWSGITEIAARLVAPITSMVLARLLTPEAFGIVATITMIISFSEIFTDAGFQKYLIQHEFKDAEDREQSTTVAFWSNLTMSLLIWGIIAVFSEELATLVGNPGFGFAITVSCVSIPLAAFSSIQMALYKRDFEFKTLFKARMVAVIVPLIVTVPLAFWLRNFWALVIGTIVNNLLNAVILTAMSRWKPRLFYSWRKFKEMFSFTVWSMIEAISIWLTGYLDIFIIGVYLSLYHVGIYKTSMGLVAQIMGIITSATTPVLFSALSRVQNDRPAFESVFFKFLKNVGVIVIPFGFGLYCYRDFVVGIFLGGQWGDAVEFFGLWAFSSSIIIMVSHYASEVYRSLGKPKLSVFSQVIYMLTMVPVLLIAVRYDFRTLYLSKVVVRFFWGGYNLLILYYFIHLSPWRILKAMAPSTLCAIVMSVFAYACISWSNNIIWTITSILLCIMVYFGTLMLFPKERTLCMGYISKIASTIKRS